MCSGREDNFCEIKDTFKALFAKFLMCMPWWEDMQWDAERTQARHLPFFLSFYRRRCHLGGSGSGAVSSVDCHIREAPKNKYGKLPSRAAQRTEAPVTHWECQRGWDGMRNSTNLLWTWRFAHLNSFFLRTSFTQFMLGNIVLRDFSLSLHSFNGGSICPIWR